MISPAPPLATNYKGGFNTLIFCHFTTCGGFRGHQIQPLAKSLTEQTSSAVGTVCRPWSAFVISWESAGTRVFPPRQSEGKPFAAVPYPRDAMSRWPTVSPRALGPTPHRCRRRSPVGHAACSQLHPPVGVNVALLAGTRRSRHLQGRVKSPELSAFGTGRRQTVACRFIGSSVLAGERYT